MLPPPSLICPSALRCLSCRARNAAGLRYKEYWSGNLAPRPTVDWYLERIATAVEAAKRATDGAPITLLAHSAGGWLGRLFLLVRGGVRGGGQQGRRPCCCAVLHSQGRQ